MTVYFIRVRAGLVIEKGWTDDAALAAMQAGSSEYLEVTRAQYDALNLGDPAP
ncbi:MAG: hypothetical protein ACJ8FU_08685 [Xanthobacteraceae bacterium]